MPPFRLPVRSSQYLKDTLLCIFTQATKCLFLLFHIILAATSRIIRPQSTSVITDFLFIKLDSLGDLTLFLPTIQSLRSSNPDCNISIVTPANYSTFLVQTNLFDHVIPVNLYAYSRNLLYRLKLVRLLSTLHATILIQGRSARDIWVDDVIAWTINAPLKTAISGDYIHTSQPIQCIADNVYNKLLPYHGNHQLQINSTIADSLDIQSTHLLDPLPSCQPPLERLSLPSRYIVLFPGASTVHRQWPPSNFASVAKHIAITIGLPIIICGASSEISLAYEIQSHCDFSIIDLVAKTSISQLFHVIAGAELLLSNDTSAVHIAALTATPSICIVGGGELGKFLPYPRSHPNKPFVEYTEMSCFGCQWRCTNDNYQPDAPFPCISAVSIEKVLDQLTSFFNECLAHD